LTPYCWISLNAFLTPTIGLLQYDSSDMGAGMKRANVNIFLEANVLASKLG
jgi:hypothetical protein